MAGISTSSYHSPRIGPDNPFEEDEKTSAAKTPLRKRTRRDSETEEAPLATPERAASSAVGALDGESPAKRAHLLTPGTELANRAAKMQFSPNGPVALGHHALSSPFLEPSPRLSSLDAPLILRPGLNPSSLSRAFDAIDRKLESSSAQFLSKFSREEASSAPFPLLNERVTRLDSFSERKTDFSAVEPRRSPIFEESSLSSASPLSLLSSCPSSSPLFELLSASPSLIASPLEVVSKWRTNIQCLHLIDSISNQNEHVLTLVKYLFSQNGGAIERKETLPYIEKFFRQVTQDDFKETKLEVDFSQLREQIRYKFADPIMNLMEEGHTPLTFAILFNYFHQMDQKRAEHLFAFPSVQRLLSKAKYPDFPYFSNPKIIEIDDVLKAMIERMPLESLPEAIGIILPKAYQQDLISTHDLKMLFHSLRRRILTVFDAPTHCICLLEKEDLLRTAIRTVKAIQSHFPVGHDLIALFDDEIEKFCSIFVLDLEHLLKPQYKKGEVVGFHEPPQSQSEHIESGDAEIDIQMMYPQLYTSSSFCAPFTANIAAPTGGGFRQKMSTFSLSRQDGLSLVRSLEPVLLHPVNDPSQDGGIRQRRYIGHDGNGHARIVWTHENQPGAPHVDPDGIVRIGTSFLLPFFEIRHPDPKKETLALSQLQIIHERASQPIALPRFISPQKKLMQYIHKNVPLPKNVKRLSNTDLAPLHRSIRQLLESGGAAPFKILPTPPGKHILVQTTLEACDLSLPQLLRKEYRPTSSSSSGQTKRLSDDDIEEVFDEKKNGISLILQYPDMETFTRMFLHECGAVR